MNHHGEMMPETFQRKESDKMVGSAADGGETRDISGGYRQGMRGETVMVAGMEYAARRFRIHSRDGGGRPWAIRAF